MRGRSEPSRAEGSTGNGIRTPATVSPRTRVGGWWIPPLFESPLPSRSHWQEMPGTCLPSTAHHHHLLHPGHWMGQPESPAHKQLGKRSLKTGGFQGVRC